MKIDDCTVNTEEGVLYVSDIGHLSDSRYYERDEIDVKLNEIRDKLDTKADLELFTCCTPPSKFKVGDKVVITKIGKYGSKFVPWTYEGTMDKYNHATAIVSNVVKSWRYDDCCKKVFYYEYHLEGVPGIAKWVFGEDNLSAYKLSRKEKVMLNLGIDKIIYKPENNATIIKFTDGTKEVAVCEAGDIYDKQKGLMVCLLKHKIGNDFIDLLEDEETKKSNIDELVEIITSIENCLK